MSERHAFVPLRYQPELPIDRLIDLLWGDDPPRTASHSVQIYVSELRKTLEPRAGRRLILRRPPGYQLDTPAETVDATRFESLVREGSARLAAVEREAGARMLRTALELWRGPAKVTGLVRSLQFGSVSRFLSQPFAG